MLSRKHYKAIAEIVKELGSVYGHYVQRHAAESFIDYFAKDNPQFDRVRFLAVCGL